MRYLLLVSHGTMAPGVHSVLRMLLGDRPDVLSYSLEDGVSADEYVEALSEVVAQIGDGDSIILLGDIVGGSPLTNALNVLAGRGLLASTIALGGLSLPMAIAALEAIDDGMGNDAAVDAIIQAAHEGARLIELDIEDDDEEL